MFVTLSPIEAQLIARLLREVRGYYEDDEEKILAILNTPENGLDEEVGTLTIDDLIMLEGKVEI